MRKPFIRPTGLKGNEKLDRMRELMGASQLNEDVKNSVVELTKIGPDGKVYGIVREGHNYFIKVTDKKSNLVTEDFKYIGGLMNKTSEAYPTYAKAIKQLNLKFMSLNEAYGKQGNFNVFEDDNLLNKPSLEEDTDEEKIQQLIYNTGMSYDDAVNMVRGNNLEELNSLTEHHPYKADQKLSATKGMGDGAEYIVDKAGVELSYDSKEGKDDSQFGDNLADKDVMDEFEAIKLSENEMAIENMLGGGEEMPEGPESLYGDQVTEGEDVNVAQLKNTKEFQDLVNYFKQNPDEAEEVKDELGSTNEAESWGKGTYKNAYYKEDGVYNTYVYHENGKYYKEQDLPQGKSKTVEISKEEFKEVRKKYIKDKLLKVGMSAAGLGFVGALMAGPLGTMDIGGTLQAVLIAAGIGAGATAALSEGDDKNNPWAICYSSLGIDKKPKEGDANFKKFEACVKGVKKDKNIKESRKGFSIQTALEKMDSIIEEVTTDKIGEILNSLTESEKEALLSTLKKKV